VKTHGYGIILLDYIAKRCAIPRARKCSDIRFGCYFTISHFWMSLFLPNSSCYSATPPEWCKRSARELHKDVYPPQPMQPGCDLKEDYHYDRERMRALFMFFDPIRGWRRVTSREHVPASIEGRKSSNY
jgi:hypothetical protein